jgi:hypothetical protein
MATVTSYRLDSPKAPKPRLPPPPIRVQRSSFNPSSPFGSSGGEPELLYDLPTPTAKSPPPLASPTSPTTRAARKRAVSPPTARRRSVTPAQALKTDLEVFADDCRAWYYNNDEAASVRMTETLATLPSSERAPYSRLQAAVRSGFHAHMAARRNAEFLARIHAVQPGCSLAPHARADPVSAAAAKERYDRFSRFVANWCTPGMPGTKPFFEALWAVMRLQAIPEELGGAGGRRIEWEVDDAVFKEAAGKDFMLEAIDVLKGVSSTNPILPFKLLIHVAFRFSHLKTPLHRSARTHGRAPARPSECMRSTPVRIHNLFPPVSLLRLRSAPLYLPPLRPNAHVHRVTRLSMDKHQVSPAR